MKRFPEKRVLITGAGSGLGRELAIEFAKMGWRIGVAEIDQKRAKETVDIVGKEGGTGLAIPCDVTKVEQLENAAKVVQKEWGGLDILINNAGVSAAGYMEKIPVDKWKWIIDINLMGAIYGCRTFIPMMEKQGKGYIVNVASSAGIASLAEMASYNVTKAGVICLSETLRMELSKKNIGVTVICPTFFKTNLMDQFTSPDERQRKLAEKFFEKSKMTANKIARDTIKGIKRNKVYVISQMDGKFIWRSKRWTPRTYFWVSSKVYKSGLFDKFMGLDQ